MGQISILRSRQPVELLLNNNDISPDLREQLRRIQDIREFAGNELHLPVKDNFQSYVALNRQYVAWSVFAAPEFSLKNKKWCYPVAGCAAYRGYFSEHDAKQYAEKLKEQGYDVFVGGVTAYSTLGWFDDPVLSTFVFWSETELAGLIFHELAHQVVFVSGDTAFNESFATAVEQEGVRRWLTKQGKKIAYQRYLEKYQRQRKFVALVQKYCKLLQDLYTKEIGIEKKRQEKALLFSRMKKDYELLKAGRQGYNIYDYWFNKPINNAQVLSVVAYNDLVPAFQAMLKEMDGDLSLFYRECQILEDVSKKDRQRRLRGLSLMQLL